MGQFWAQKLNLSGQMNLQNDVDIYFFLQAYGLKFIINVEGLAWKFTLKNTVLNVGNGLALLGITTVVCEFVLMYFINVGKIDIKSDHFVPAMFSILDWV